MSREMTASIRRLPSSPAAPPLEDDNLLAEILLRLPPLPSSLPRASLVSERWHSLASDPRFSRRFRAHHRRNPPLLGCFVRTNRKNFFHPALKAPNRIPEGRFTLPIASNDCFMNLGCRHGLVLICNTSRKHLLVWDPVTGKQHRLDIPPGFLFQLEYPINGAVLRPAGDVEHFQVVLVGNCERQHTRLVASVYSSETGAWGDLTSTLLPSDDSSGLVNGRVYWDIPVVMVGNSLYWFVYGRSFGILEYDLDRRNLALIPVPGEIASGMSSRNFWVISAEGGGLGFLFLSGFSAQLWKRKTDCDGIASWVLRRAIALDKLLSIHSQETYPSSGSLRKIMWSYCGDLWASSRSSLNHCSLTNFPNPTSSLFDFLHLKVSILQTRLLMGCTMVLDFCKIYNMISPRGHAVRMN